MNLNKIMNEIAEEIQEEISSKAKTQLKLKMKELEAAKRVVRNLEEELEVLKADITDQLEDV